MPLGIRIKDVREGDTRSIVKRGSNTIGVGYGFTKIRDPTTGAGPLTLLAKVKIIELGVSDDLGRGTEAEGMGDKPTTAYAEG